MQDPMKSRSEMKRENEMLLDVAAQEAAGRNVAENAAVLEALQRQAAEDAAVKARLAANRAGFEAARLQTERNVLHDDLEAERASASNANFAMALLGGIALVGLIAFGIWFATGGNNRSAADANGTSRVARADSDNSGRAATVTTPQPSAPVRSAGESPVSAAHHDKPKAAKSKPAATHSARTPAPEMASSPSVAMDGNEAGPVEDSSSSDDSTADSTNDSGDAAAGSDEAKPADSGSSPSDGADGK